MAVSSNLTAILNFVALMCSIPIISSGIWLASKPGDDCIHWIRWPLLFIGIAFLVVALTGFLGAYKKKEGLLGVYLVCMAMLIAVLLVLLVLAFVVTRPDGAYSIPQVGFREYKLEGYSSWLRDQVTGNDNWGKIRACLADTQACSKLANRYFSAADFFAGHLSSVESGCCKPPIICGLQYSSPTTWIGSSNVAADADCAIWNNDQRILCYNCDSCKAGLLENLKQEWRNVSIILIITLVVLIWVYLIACSAYRNAKKG